MWPTGLGLTQEVFLRAWQRFGTLRTYERPEGWLFRVATNLALTHLRRRGGRADAAIPLESVRDPGASDPGRHVAESELVRRVLLGPPPRPRAALVLREVYGLSGEEIARTLGMSASAVRVALHRARERFRELYRLAEGSQWCRPVTRCALNLSPLRYSRPGATICCPMASGSACEPCPDVCRLPASAARL